MSSNLNRFAKNVFCAAMLGIGLTTVQPAGADGGTPGVAPGATKSWICRYHMVQSRWFIHCVDPERDEALLDLPDARAAAQQVPALAPEMYIPLYGGYPSSSSRAETLVRAVLCPRDAPCHVVMAVGEAQQVQIADVEYPRRRQAPRGATVVRR